MRKPLKIKKHRKYVIDLKKYFLHLPLQNVLTIKLYKALLYSCR
jgi:hypothetical protein